MVGGEDILLGESWGKLPGGQAGGTFVSIDDKNNFE